MIEFLKQGLEYGLIGAGAVLSCGGILIAVLLIISGIADAIKAIGKHGGDE